MANIGIFYAPKGGNTEKVAQKVHKNLVGSQMFSVPEAGVNEMMQFDYLVMGIATIGKETWDQKIKKSGWDLILSNIDKADFTGKTVAIFGLGDSVTYDLQFVDAIGILGRKLREKGAELVGFVPTKDYNFRESEAIENDMFMGLPIDEDFEDDKTDERIAEWTQEITKKMS